MNTNTVKLFDNNDNLVPDFDQKIESILISVHGENYYDTDEKLVNTNLISINKILDSKEFNKEDLEKTMEYVNLLTEDAKAVKIVEQKNKGVSIKDFIPVVFFILIFAIIIIAGYNFLNTIDLTSFIS